MPTSRRFWNAAYETGEYLKHWDYHVPSQELVGAIAAGIVPANGTTLDVGCGTGTEAVFLARCGFRSIGVDVSSAALAMAARRAAGEGATVDWREGDALALPVADAAIDFINDRGCFHHIRDADRPTYVAEVARVLKPGGVLFVRGAREAGDVPFELVTEDAIARFFRRPTFATETVLPITLISDAGTLKANLAVLRRM